MRATFFGIEIGKRGIMTQRAAMDVTSHNIANANTEGYARQRAVISATDPWSVPGYNAPVTAQQLGTGVDVTKIESLRDAFVDEKITRETASLEQWSVASDLMAEVEAIINEPNDATLRDQLDKFWAAWQDLSVSPSSEALRRNLVEETTTLITSFQDIDTRLGQLQGTPDHEFEGSIENQLEDAVDRVNTLTKQIAQLNVEIERVETANASANDLRDKRLSLVQELSGVIAIDTSWNTKGQLSLRSGTQLLVEHSAVHELFLVRKDKDLPVTISGSPDYPQLSDDPDVAEAVFNHTGASRNITLTVAQTAQAHQTYSFLSYHPLTGPLSDFGVSDGTFSVNGRTFYLDAENTSMKQLATMLDEANLEIDAQLNEVGQLVMTSTLTGTAHEMKFADGTSNLMTVLNLQQNQAARDAVFNYGGKQYVTSENVVRDVVPGATLILKGHGVANIDLRPIVTGGKVQGLLEIRDGEIQELRDKFNEMAYRLVTEVNDVHRKGFGLDGETGRNFFKSIATDDASQPYKDVIRRLEMADYITENLNTIAASQGTLENPTDKLPSFNGEGDGLNAVLIARIKQNEYFSNGKANFNDFYNALVTEAATETQRFDRQKSSTEDLMTQLKSKRDEISGVSLDEELTNLIKFQHAYNAASKVITTVDEMLDKIINGMI
ncbi:MAG TPA: flagellar hook-associated protein FlgK [Candidatus Ozemobacteraceae bacterium]|nr:flagellar hook-associated protein FlgK [Candidatus Ozemobacteraceae bacterium]